LADSGWDTCPHGMEEVSCVPAHKYLAFSEHKLQNIRGQTSFCSNSIEKFNLTGLNTKFEAEDRANLIHDVFMEAYTGRYSYSTVVQVLNYLKDEADYVPWRAIYHHVNFLVKILDYDKSFLQVSTYFIKELKQFELDSLWSPNNTHIEELRSETILELACRLQDQYCINKTTDLWSSTFPTGSATIPPYVRSIVYNYHFQNTYDVKDWELFFTKYNTQTDLLEQERYLKALTFTRLPWLLAEYLNK
jgi:hypothetical protein